MAPSLIAVESPPCRSCNTQSNYQQADYPLTPCRLQGPPSSQVGEVWSWGALGVNMEYSGKISLLHWTILRTLLFLFTLTCFMDVNPIVSGFQWVWPILGINRITNSTQRKNSGRVQVKENKTISLYGSGLCSNSNYAQSSSICYVCWYQVTLTWHSSVR